MALFRKKPVVVEAFQMTRERRLDKSEWPDWLKRAGATCDLYSKSALMNDDPETSPLFIATLEG